MVAGASVQVIMDRSISRAATPVIEGTPKRSPPSCRALGCGQPYP